MKAGEWSLGRPRAEPRQDDGRGEQEDGERAAPGYREESRRGGGGCPRRGRGSAPSCRTGGVLESSWRPRGGGRRAMARGEGLRAQLPRRGSERGGARGWGRLALQPAPPPSVGFSSVPEQERQATEPGRCMNQAQAGAGEKP